MLIQNLSDLVALHNIGKKSVNIFINQVKCIQSMFDLYLFIVIIIKPIKNHADRKFIKLNDLYLYTKFTN
jgi:hypothetical protein